MSDPVVVVGGDAAGLSAASKVKRETPEREVVVFEKGQWVSYAHCGMPYFVKGEIDAISDLLSLSPDDIEERDIDLRRNHEVTAVSPDDRTVTVAGPDGTTDQSYGDLLIGTGARATTGPFETEGLTGAFTLHHMDSAAALRAFLTPSDEEPAGVDCDFLDHSLVDRYAALDPPETVAIVGGGYVGIEMAEAFRAHDRDVHLFQRPDHVLPPFGEAVGEAVEDHIADEGVTVHTNTAVDEIRGQDSVEAVVADGSEVSVDAALVGIGIRPNTELVRDTGIECGESGAILTDDYGRTGVEDIYAAGDCAEMDHAVTGESSWVPLGLTANRAGRAIGQTIAGDETPVGSIAGTAVVKAFELEAGRTGIVDHDDAREAGFDPVSETITASSRSGYYPGAAETTVTLTADRESGRLLGGSIVGRDRAAKRIDTLATALETDMTVGEFERLDLSYAPPFSPVWDPLLVGAKVLNGAVGE